MPELRWSAVLAHRERDGEGKETIVYEHLKRLGKKRGAVLEYILAAGMVAEIPELLERFASPKTRPRDFRRRVLADMEETGVVEVVGDAVMAHPEWSERLEQARFLADEHGAARRQKDRFERERQAYRTRNERPADPAPTEEEVRDLSEGYPDRRRRAIEHAIGCLFEERPEFRERRVGQIVCKLPRYLPEGFPPGDLGLPKDHEVEEILKANGVTA